MDKFAIYFPQFYSIDLNDNVWGKDFTDWHLVSYANAHNLWDRRAPAKGFYVGNSEISLNVQIQEALSYGLTGFGVYHYYFNNGSELDFVEEALQGSSKISWFLIWANEDWSKRWVGDHTVINTLDRDLEEEFVRRHVKVLSKRFSNSKYYKIGGRPLFVIYNLSHFTSPEKMISLYKRLFKEEGIEPLIVGMIKTVSDFDLLDFLDGAYIFEPRYFFNTKRIARGTVASAVLDSLRRRRSTSKYADVLIKVLDLLQQRGKKFLWKDFLKHMDKTTAWVSNRHEGINYQWILSPGWNNAPRYGKRYTKLQTPMPRDLRTALSKVNGNTELPLVLNAWNEWSEGAAVEPCHYLGDSLIKIIRDCEL